MGKYKGRGGRMWLMVKRHMKVVLSDEDSCCSREVIVEMRIPVEIGAVGPWSINTVKEREGEK